MIAGLGFIVGTDTGIGNLFLNLGTEVFGIVITVAIVDMLLKRQSHRETAANYARIVLVEVDKFVYKWQGGDPGLDVGELLSLLSKVKPDNAKNLNLMELASIGSTAATLLRIGSPVCKSNGDLKKGLEELASFEYVYEGYENDPLTDENLIAKKLSIAIKHLAKVSGHS